MAYIKHNGLCLNVIYIHKPVILIDLSVVIYEPFCNKNEKLTFKN